MSLQKILFAFLALFLISILVLNQNTLATTNTDAPINLQSIPGDKKIILSWNPNPDIESPVHDYIIQYKLDGDSTWLTFSDGTSILTTAIVTNLTNDKLYSFRVLEVTSMGVSSPSNVSYAIPIKSTQTIKSVEIDSVHPSPKIKGIGFYTIDVSEEAVSALIPFADYFPYSTYSNTLDLENYGNYEKRGQFYELSENTQTIQTFPAVINQPIQIQVRLYVEIDSTKIEHLTLRTNFNGIGAEGHSISDTYITFEKGRTTVVDPNNFFESVEANYSLEDGWMWVIFDVVFAKPLTSDIMLQTWHEGRVPTYSIIKNAWQISESKIVATPDKIGLTDMVDITHDASSPICKKTDFCFHPSNAEILVGGIVTWTNNNAFIHSVTSGTPLTGHDNRFVGYIPPGKTFQQTFEQSGIFPYYCVIHPWAMGQVTVYDEDDLLLAPDDPSKPPIFVATTQNGSLMIENEQNVVFANRDLRVIVSGHIQDVTKSKSIEITITRPDGTTSNLNTYTNQRGYYSTLVQLDTKWKTGDYSISTSYRGAELGSITFHVSDH